MTSTAYDNVFLGIPYVLPTAKGLSDHEQKFLVINYINATTNIIPSKCRTRKTSNNRVIFQLLLKTKTWQSVYKSSDTSNKFNSFSQFLKISLNPVFQWNMKYRQYRKSEDYASNNHVLQVEISPFSTEGTLIIQQQKHFQISTVKS
jgi:hypothetical protein